MTTAQVILTATLEAWQPTINTLALIVLAIIGNEKFRSHRRRAAKDKRINNRRMNELEGIAADTQLLVRRVEQLLDSNSGPETSHLH